MNFATEADIENQIMDILNAAKTYGGGVTVKHRTAGGIAAARVAAGKAVLRAIFSNPQGEYFGGFISLVEFDPADDNFITETSTVVGIPVIQPFPDAPRRQGIPADVDEIDSFINSPELYTGAVDGAPVPHDEPDADGKMSPIACRYNITNRRLTFTGYKAYVPLLPEITDTLARTSIPQGVSPAVVKLAIPLCVKEGDNLALISREYAADGKQDLVEIAGGAIRVRPVRTVSDIIAEQKQT